MQSIGADILVSPEDVAPQARPALDIHLTWGLREDRIRATEFSICDLGGLTFTSGRTSSVACVFKNKQRAIVKLFYTGRGVYRDDVRSMQADAGGVMLFPADQGRLLCIEDSSVCFQISTEQFARTVAIMAGGELGPEIRPCLLSESSQRDGGPGTNSLFALFRYIDFLLLEDRHIGSGMNLDDQIYRLLAFHHLRGNGGLGLLAARGSGSRRWSHGIDELVDYIRAEAHQGLSLTDLEGRSGYSARHLQTLFREKFDCTPMQFVRRQRLGAALERIKQGRCDDSVTRVARDHGYRSVSNFSHDFRREFGVSPSVALRSARVEAECRP